MHAYLIPSPADSPPTPPPTTYASCRLVSPQTGWLLALTERAGDAPYEVEQVHGLPEGSGAFAAVVEFDGPRDDAQVAADQRASRDRIWPAAAQVPGTLGAMVLRADDGAMVTVAFADSVAALEAASRAILSTPLLPGEDPALLDGPVRWTACRVAADTGVAELVRSHAAAEVGA